MTVREVTREEIAKEKAKKKPFGIWYVYKRTLNDNRVVYLFHLGGGMTIGISHTPEDKTFSAEYNYWDVPTERAWRSAIGWDGEGEPEGWSRARVEGQMHYRRRPEGDPAKEYQSE